MNAVSSFSTRNLARVAAAALLAGFAAVNAQAQTTPAKPQLPTAPTPGATPAPPAPRPVIIQPDTSQKRPVKAAVPEPEKQKEEKEEKPKVPFGKRLMFGGGGGLQFGDITMVDLSPMVGYRFSERFIAGPGIVYQYMNFRNSGSFHTYGGSVFARGMIYNNFFGHAEYEMVNMPRITYDQVFRGYFIEEGKRMNVSSLLVGGGYRFMLGERSSIDALVLFNLLDPGTQNFQRYNNPVIRIGFSGGW